MSGSFPTPSPPQGASPFAPPAAAGDKKSSREQPRIRRRNRLITSCLECRRRKLKCDKASPCSNCTKFSRQCVFIAPGLDPESQARLAEVKEKMGILERTLEDDVARRSRSKSASRSASSSLRPPTLPGQDESYSEQDDDDETRDLEPLSTMTEDAAYYEDEGNDDIVDLGISMGKLRITERVGGFFRPRLSEEASLSLKEIPKTEHGNPLSEQSVEAWMAPGPDYVAPSSTFFFSPGVERTTLMTHLPSKVLVDKLIDHYWQAVHVLARTVHRPTFERQYEMFWRNINTGLEPRISFQAVVYAAMLSSVISMSEERVLTEFGVDKQILVDNIKAGTESALSRANFLRTTKLETLQAFVMYLIPLCRAEVSRAHSALTGTCIRLAECMGLHRDPTTYSSSAVEIHVRRLVWHQICFLDLRTCEATGPRPQIRRDEYDTRFPLNVDDVDLDRAEERGETSITALLSRIQAFKAAMEKTYLPMLNKSIPLHVLAMEMYGILSDRMYLMVLQKFVSNQKYKMPQRLRQIVLSTAVMLLEHSMTIEQQPALAPWAWYVGALHQYHTALLLLSEMYAGERDPAMENRIWRCLDYAFELPASLSGFEKTRLVFEELAGRTEMYAAIRRMRAPTAMPHAGPRNEWDALFGNANMDTDGLVVPPFTFPLFSAADLQWLPQGGLQ
ncbi:fungal-specific transcription factor domain-containing protein [Corynespora cassiicola Philippines]|uniref:Fungal-specific transcription factor domain-containing protein n=1 Tax=Corynespora cassiicola Philippines TaxID=1448308 RepID=A0A2T2NBN1_CORCC|nr:fungal-specific transcription factor domain-containing protein [Corynespora cassiicola Philippines]